MAKRNQIQRKEFLPWHNVDMWLHSHTYIDIVGIVTKPYKFDNNKNITIIYYKEKECPI